MHSSGNEKIVRVGFPAVAWAGLVALVVVVFGGLLVPGAAAGSCPNDAFRTGVSAGLSDCRAYELVSPADKTGSDVMVDTGRTRISAGEAPGSPMAVMFPSLGGFGDVLGTGNATDYVSSRDLAPGTDGWSRHAVAPPQNALSFEDNANGLDPLYVAEAAPDLGQAIFQAKTPLSDAPNVAGVINLYLRSNLRTPGAGAYQLLTNASVPLVSLGAVFGAVPRVAGSTADMRHVLFESAYQMTPDAPASPTATKLYESVDGVLRNVGILPASQGGGPAPRAIAGQGTGVAGPSYTPHVISSDGSRVFFTVPSSDGATSGNLYLRDDHGTVSTADDTTTQLNVPEAGADPQQDATYWDASADGSRVFFMTKQSLTADSAVSGFEKLYMYDASKPASDPHNLTYISADHEPADNSKDALGTLGVSDDGSYVYFLALGQLVAGQPVLGFGLGIYVWHDGQTHYIGHMVDDLRDPLEDLGGYLHDYGIFSELGAVVSPDGQHLLLSLREAPWPGGLDHGSCHEPGLIVNGKVGCRELYVYDAATNAHPVCVSCGAHSELAVTPAFWATRTGTGNASTSSHLNHPMTVDGGHVFFTTGEALVPGDRNGSVDDVYEWDASDGSVHLISSGTGSSDSIFLDATPDGHDVFFATRDRLSPWDVDQSIDIYDARVDGGVPGPVSPPGDCVGEDCHGPLSVAPFAALAGSSTYVPAQGAGPLRCGKGQARRMVGGVLRCVKAKPAVKRCRKGTVRKRTRGGTRCVRVRGRHARVVVHALAVPGAREGGRS